MPPLNDSEIADRLAALDGWKHNDGAISKSFDRGNFVGAVEFINQITPVAEQMNHHPDLAVSWKDVTVTLTTHSEGGLTGNDFLLAERIDTL